MSYYDDSEIERTIDTWDFETCSVYRLMNRPGPDIYRVETLPRYDEAHGKVEHMLPLTDEGAEAMSAALGDLLKAGRDPLLEGWAVIWEED